MMHRLNLLLLLCLAWACAWAQSPPSSSCGQQAAMQDFYRRYPQYRQINEQAERLLKTQQQQLASGQLKTQRTNGVVTLPVVVHIIHNNGSENITDAQVFQGIQHLNEAFANSGYYDPADGVNTQIQFCMAQRDPTNNPTNGITRDVSAYTVMGGSNYYSDDQNVKNINRWNPNCYINIWLVKSIPTSVVGYAYLPAAHGSPVDGIIEEAAYFGSSYANDVVIIHETGHYLGLYHTFEGNCTNNDCTSDGDKVCDTPPDQSTAGISCTSAANSCTTDVLSGFATDQNDLTQDYMDYGNFNCMKVFTQGQADRMNWFIQNTRKSLLACKSCINPCPAPVTADFSVAAAPFAAGSNYTFTNTSANAASYEWYVNGIPAGTAGNLIYTFAATGTYSIKLIAKSGSVLCDDASKTVTVDVVCGALAAFSASAHTAAAGSNINFTNGSTGADSYEWYVNGSLQSSSSNFSYTSLVAGDYIINLVAKSTAGNCQSVLSDTVHFTCPVLADFAASSTNILANTTVIFTAAGSGASNWSWLVNNIPEGSGPTFSYTFTTKGIYDIQLVAGNGTCKAAKNGWVIVHDKCGNEQTYFQKTYDISNTDDLNHILSTADGGTVQSICYRSGGGGYDAGLLKLDNAGNPVWAKKYSNNRSSKFTRIRVTNDGGYIAAGFYEIVPNLQSGSFITKTNASGATTWHLDITTNSTRSLSANDVLASADGNYYIVGDSYDISSTVNRTPSMFVAKIDPAGNIIWLKQYNSTNNLGGSGITEDNGQLLICGNMILQTGYAGMLANISKVNGNLNWANSYQAGFVPVFSSISTINNGYFIDGLLTYVSAPQHSLLETDKNGVPVVAGIYQAYNPQGIIAGFADRNTNGQVFVTETPSRLSISPYTYFTISCIDLKKSRTVWSRRYNQPNTILSTLSVSSSNRITATGLIKNPLSQTGSLFVLGADSVGQTGTCPSEAIDNPFSTFQYQQKTISFTVSVPQFTVNREYQDIDQTVSATVICQTLPCDSLPVVDTCNSCKTLSVLGPDTACLNSGTALFRVRRDSLCPLPVKWSIDSSYATILSSNDSTLSLQFIQAGTVKLYAGMFTPCGWIRDSMLITIFKSPGAINLGPDMQLCTFSSMKLNAGSGFASYLWNDGSVDSVLTVFNPGLYTVTAKDYCGNTYTDNINITLAPDIPFDLGPDLQKCNTDTLTISAPGSFPGYSWAVNYNINSIKGSTVKVWPAVDTTYTVVAELSNGCTVIDTIRVTVNKSAPLQLGNDTSFCAGDSLLLQAPAGFTNYLWQDGSGATSLTALQPGLYWLQAKAANGCVSKDSLTINNVYPLPLNFLDAAKEICNGRDLVLQPSGNWAAYLWFNNSSSSSVTVQTAGKYWLQVTSAQGCKGRDTIEVQIGKNCGTGIHFPNAFTPDQNGNNDTWKPVAFTIPAVYHLLIYNRFGEKVFETSDYKQGWDGIYKGRLQAPDTFVWYCSYQFAGADPRLEKGALILVR